MSDEMYLITGASGFVGSNIVRHLIAQGKKVSIILRDTKHAWRIEDILKKIQVVETNLLSPTLEKDLTNLHPTYIFHLAAYGALPQESSADKTIDVNLKGTIRLLNALKNTHFRLFINTGSSSEYGYKESPMVETDLPQPLNDYGVVKVAQTLYCAKLAIRESLPIITFRLFSPYGYYEDKNRLFSWVITNALLHKPIALSSPTNVRDFVFIEDVVDAYIKACSSTFNPGDIFNIGSGEQHSVEDIVNYVVEFTHSTSKIEWGTIPEQERQVEPSIWQADIKKIKKQINWKPKHSLKEGIEKTIVWFTQHKHLYE